ncbi:MAG: methylated-DNA--[protein]-cysteine S-methyltransferase [Dehalococcoidia bacterium]
MRQINTKYHETTIGQLVLGSFRGRLCFVEIRRDPPTGAANDRLQRLLDADFVEQDDDVLEETRRQLDEYLSGTREDFDIPLLLVGTDFQKRVWEALLAVPYGTTATYGQIARDVGNEKAVRAVGNACRANPIGIIVPCHRIVGSDGSLVGYYGGLSVKERLLKLEQGADQLVG